MRVYAISDLHVGHQTNARALREIGRYPQDWLIVAGDVGETLEHVASTLAFLTTRFARVVWVPGNHELWTIPQHSARGPERYEQLVGLCRRYGVLTPEDPFESVEVDGTPYVIAPLFLLYDYTFRPDDIPAEESVNWAMQSGILCADEEILHPEPFASIADWCAHRCDLTERRLLAIDPGRRTILVNHYPLRQRLAVLPAIPRFSIWCGTRRTDDWHRRFNAHVVISGHLHIRRTDWFDGVRFEEVSLGYPRHWQPHRGIDYYLRDILPGPAPEPVSVPA